MKAGRDLDKLIAEKVMGWKENSSPSLNSFSMTGKWLLPNGRSAMEVPYYSTDIAAAWEVVEKIKADGFRLHYDLNYGVEKKMGWTVCLDGVVYPEFCETASHAICLAALEIVGKKE